VGLDLGGKAPGFLSGGGEMGERIRAHDWAATPLGEPDAWPQPLRAALSLCLKSNFPTAIYWGDNFCLLYNDAWSPIPGERHPAALGRPAIDVWSDIWAVVGPQLTLVMQTGEGFSVVEQLLPMMRNGAPQETYWNYSFTPICAEDGTVLGVFNQGHETTQEVLARAQTQSEIQRLGSMFAHASTAAAILRGPSHRIEVVNPAFTELVGKTGLEGKTVAEAFPELVAQGFLDLLNEVFSTGRAHVGREVEVIFDGQSNGQRHHIVDFVYQPLADPGGIGKGVFIQATDVTDAIRVEAALRESEAKYEAIVNSIDQMIWSTLPNGDHDYFNSRWYDFTGVAQGDTNGANWKLMFHPDDQERARKTWMHSVRTGEPYHIEYRLRYHTGGYRWVVGRARCVRGSDGSITRWFGTCTDINNLKETEAKRQLLLREMDHRIKNLFTVTGGMISMTAQTAPSVSAMATSLRGRLHALAKAHDLIRSAVGGEAGSGQITSLRTLIQDILQPHLGEGDEKRVSLNGPPILLGDDAAVGLALIFHELATNAMKYGALGKADGLLAVTWTSNGDRLELSWAEQSSDRMITPPRQAGFGSELAQATATDQLRGMIRFDWRPTGVVVELTARLENLQQ